MIELSENHQPVLHIVMQSCLQSVWIKGGFGGLHDLGIQMHQAVIAQATVFCLFEKLPCLRLELHMDAIAVRYVICFAGK